MRLLERFLRLRDSWKPSALSPENDGIEEPEESGPGPGGRGAAGNSSPLFTF